MNKQFSPFLQRYFLIITEVISNQIWKYRGIFKHFKTYLIRDRLPKKPYTDIDEKIRPLVEALNSLESVVTIASCQGHASWSNPPYVAFFAREAVAAEIQSLFVDKHWRKLPLLAERWVVEASFNLDCQLVYCLQSKTYHRMASSIFGSILLALYRTNIDKDIQNLTRLIKIHVRNQKLMRQRSRSRLRVKPQK